MSDGNGKAIPIVGGLPILSQACPWSWECFEVGRAEQSGEKVYLLRLRLPTGPLELWAPASFLRDFGEKITAQAAGLHIAGEMPPP